MKSYIAFIIFIFGLYFCLTYTHGDIRESFDNSEPDPSIPSRCYNLLIQKGSQYHLVNTKKAMIPGVNPIKFKDLGEYVQYVKWQQKMKINCPVLYFQTTYDTQGKVGYRLLDDPLNPQGGVKSELLHTPKSKKWFDELLDASTDSKMFNKYQYAGFDPEDQHIGEHTILDEKYVTGGMWNPMQSDWGGIEKSEKYAKLAAAERTRSVDELLEPIIDKHSENRDRMAVQVELLKPTNTRVKGRRERNEEISKNNLNNRIIKDALKK